jgi:hypothetical protein
MGSFLEYIRSYASMLHILNRGMGTNNYIWSQGRGYAICNTNRREQMIRAAMCFNDDVVKQTIQASTALSSVLDSATSLTGAFAPDVAFSASS